MEKLRNLLFYGGAMPDVYRNCRDEIRKENLEKLFFFLSVEIVFLLMALAVCCAVKSLAGGFIAYIIALACALVLFRDETFCEVLAQKLDAERKKVYLQAYHAAE